MVAVAARPLTLDAARSGAALYLDETRARISVRGKDRFSWLNGILSNDVAALEKLAAKAPHALYACALTEKGKILADAIVVAGAVEGELSVWVPARVATGLVEGWDRYVIMEDVELARDDSRRLLFVQGGSANAMAERLGLRARGASFDDLGVSGGLVFDLAREEAEEIARRFASEGAVSLDVGDQHTLRVEAARATFGFDFDDKSYVQEAGLEKRAVSFTKGCYHGQEVVCMLEMRGHVTKKLVQLRVESTVEVGAEVTSDGTSIGKLTSVVPHEDGSTTALAIVKFAHATPDASLTVAGKPARVLAAAS